MVFDHENLNKTRRSILIICILIIAAENYLSPISSGINFGGLTLSITKTEIIGSLCLGLSYLWIVVLAQLLNGPILEITKKRRVRVYSEISEAFTDPRDNAYKIQAEESHNNDPEVQATEMATSKFNFYFRIFESYSQFIFWVPMLLLSIIIIFKHDGFWKAVSTITKILG